MIMPGVIYFSKSDSFFVLLDLPFELVTVLRSESTFSWIVLSSIFAWLRYGLLLKSWSCINMLVVMWLPSTRTDFRRMPCAYTIVFCEPVWLEL